MPVEIGDVLYLVVKGTVLNQDWVNQYWYEAQANDPVNNVSQLLAVWAWDVLYSPLSVILNDQWTVREADAYLYKNPPADYGQVTGIQDGGSIDQPAPSALCATFYNPPPFPGQRYSYKRLAGLSESHINGNTLLPQAAFEAYAQAIDDPLSLGSTVLHPVQVQTKTKPPLGTGINPTVNRKLTSSWSYKLGTQNSRKPGYGS